MSNFRIILFFSIFLINFVLSQNSSIFFLRDGSIVQGTVVDENQRRIFLKTDQGTLKISPENILGREDLAKQGDLTFMSERIDFLQRHVEYLTGKTNTWKDSLSSSLDNISAVFRGMENLQRELEVDLLRLHDRDKIKNKQLTEMAHDIVGHDVDISYNKQNIDLISDSISNSKNKINIIEDNLSRTISQSYVLSGSVASILENLKSHDDRVMNNKSQVDIMSGSVANLYREVQRVEGSFDSIIKSINDNIGSINLNRESINSNNNLILESSNIFEKKIISINDTIKINQDDLINTMELLWKKNNKAITELKNTIEDTLYQMKRNVSISDKKIDSNINDISSNDNNVKSSLSQMNETLSELSNMISVIERNISTVSSKVDALDTRVSKMKK